MQLSVVVLTKNNEDEIVCCLKSVAFCNEIIVIDDYSTDTTRTIAKKHGAHVYKRHLNNNFSKQRNFGLSKATNEWILFIDSDEIVPQQLQQEIRDFLHNTKNTHIYSGVYMKRSDFQFGRLLHHGETAHTIYLRLAKKNAGGWERSVHEVWKISGKTTQLTHSLHHKPHQTLSEFIADINHYSTLHAQVVLQEGKRTSGFAIVAYPFAKFVHNFIIRGGIFDGTAGFLIAMCMSFHSFLARAKLYIYQQSHNV